MKERKDPREEKNTLKKKTGCFLRLVLVFVFLLLVFCIVLCFRYQAWLGNMPEKPYTVPQSIDRITLTPGADFMHERTISWRHDTLRHNSRIEYFRVDSSETELPLLASPVVNEDIISRAGHAYYYHVHLHNLEEGARYKFRIVSEDASSAWKHFRMPSTQDTIRFLYMGDVQDEHGFVSDSLLQRLQEREFQYDFLAFGGDQIERPMDKYWAIWYKSIQAWEGRVPIIAVTGNHEYLKGLINRLDPRWKAQHNYPENGPKGFKGKTYYIDFPLMRMIVIDSNVIHWPYAIAQHYRWLKQTLKETTQPWKVVMFHHSVFPVREGRMHPFMRYLFLPLLKKYDTDLVLQGHDHAYSRITTKVNGDTIPPVFVISNTSPKFYRNGFDPVHDRLGSGISLYQKIQITQNKLTYQSLFFDGEIYDDLIIERTPEGKKSVIDNARGWKEVFRYDDFDNTEKGKKKRDSYLQEVQKREASRLSHSTH